MRAITIQYDADFSPQAGSEAGIVLAIGEFDGLHLGHREVISRAVGIAGRLGLQAAVMTFDPHPREVLGQEKYAHHLTPLPQKLELLADSGIDLAYVVRFDAAFAAISPRQFVEDILIRLNVRAVVVGFDFRFGHKGAGDADQMRRLGEGRFEVEIVQPFHLNGMKVSSTTVRACLEAGELGHAEQLLGRRYALTGTVVHGDARGRQIGFPTANIALDAAYFMPCNGVFAASLEWEGKRRFGVVNIGTRPTFEGEAGHRSIEMHLFDFSDSIYDRSVRLELISFIRSERKFASVDELVAQIKQDVRAAKERMGYPHLL